MQFQKFKSFVNESEEQIDEMQESMERSFSEYLDATKKLLELQKRFIQTPKEKINQREDLKREIAAANRDMLLKQGEFHGFLADSGDGDIFNDNENQ